jgi:hypothetical protein
VSALVLAITQRGSGFIGTLHSACEWPAALCVLSLLTPAYQCRSGLCSSSSSSNYQIKPKRTLLSEATLCSACEERLLCLCTKITCALNGGVGGQRNLTPCDAM